jgi:hypothetical protein
VIDPVRRRRGIAFLVSLALVGVGVLWVITGVKARSWWGWAVPRRPPIRRRRSR